MLSLYSPLLPFTPINATSAILRYHCTLAIINIHVATACKTKIPTESGGCSDIHVFGQRLDAFTAQTDRTQSTEGDTVHQSSQ